MGIYASATVVYGVPLAYESTPKTVTRYDSVTGEPYGHVITESHRVFVLPNGSRKTLPEPFLGDGSEDEYDEFCVGYETGGLGITVAHVNCMYDHFESVILEGTQEKFSAFARKFHPDIADVLETNARLYIVNTSG